MTRPWLKLHREAVRSVKFAGVGLEGYGLWAVCLMLSDNDGFLPPVAQIAHEARAPLDLVAKIADRLHQAGLLDVENAQYRLHDWADHQNVDPTNAARQKRHRDKVKGADVTPRNALRNDVTHKRERQRVRELEPSSESHHLADKWFGSPDSEPRAPKQSTKRRWPPDAVIPDEWILDAAAARERAGKSPVDLKTEAERFANHFAANGKAMVDWRRTWLNWATSPYVDNLKGKSNGKGFDAFVSAAREFVREGNERGDGGGGDGEGGGDAATGIFGK
jgi:hypothetical protein